LKTENEIKNSMLRSKLGEFLLTIADEEQIIEKLR